MKAHERIRETLGAYALDAVEDAERDVIARHLETCEACRAEVDAHRRAAATMTSDAPAPPGRVWEAISREVRADPRPGRVVALERARERRPASRRIAAALAAAVAAIAFLGWRVADLSGPSDLREVAAAAAEDPSARRATLGGSQVVVLDDGSGYLFGEGLASLPDDRTYQLWAMDGDRVVSAGVLGSDPGVVAFTVAPDTAALALTEEAAGGVAAPSTDPIAVGELL